MTGLRLLAYQRVDPRVLLHEQFDKAAWDPDTWQGIVITVCAILALLVVLHFVFYYQKRTSEPRVVDCPQKLFAEVLRQLQLTGAQREILRKMARDLRLPDPTSMLLSPAALQSVVERWHHQRNSRGGAPPQHISAIAVALFGAPLPVGSSH